VLKKELNSCTECFITGTTRGITPVTRIDDRKIGKGIPGENTKFLMKLLHDTMVKECK
jgi:branched-subunit amino acid aminotransferase/4-amino-4-deoxychorismate lyase